MESKNRRWTGVFLSGMVGVVLTVAVLSLSSAAAAPIHSSPARLMAKSSVNKFVSKCGVGASPNADAYDPVDHEIYVANEFSRNVSVVKAPCKVVATIKLPSGASPYAAAFDPSDNHVYVTDVGRNVVYLISGTKVTQTDTGFSYPDAILYDPAEGSMLVANGDSNNVTIVVGSFVGTPGIPVGTDPTGLDYDPTFPAIVVDNYGSSNVTLVNATCPGCDLFGPPVNMGSFEVPAGAYASAFDPVTDDDYVVNNGDPGNVAIVVLIPGLTAVIGNVSVGSYPDAITFAQASLDLYVANSASHNISVLSGGTLVNTLEMPSISVPTGFAYDDANNWLYVTDAGGTGTLRGLAT